MRSSLKRTLALTSRRCVALAGLTALMLLALPAGAASARAQPERGTAATAPSAGPAIRIMVVGAGNVILSQPENISVPITAVSTSHGPCTIAAATPLAALVDLRRVGGPPLELRDEGHCGSSPTASRQLVVQSVDGQTDHGGNGWRYKVDARIGTAGAGDPRGPFGNGRLLANGAEVVWFWCQSFGGGCQRTLAVGVPSTAVSAGGSVSVKVTGYDDAGHGKAMSGARVSIAGDTATTGGSGRVTLRAPSRPGLYPVRASRPGSVPSFPETVVVR